MKPDSNFRPDNNHKTAENKYSPQRNENEKNLNFSFNQIEEFNQRIFEVSDFLPGRISEISNNIEKMNLEGVQKETIIKRDFNNTHQNLKEDKAVNNINIYDNHKSHNNKNRKRLTIDLIAKDMGLITDEIDYPGLNEFSTKNNDYFYKKEKNESKNNPVQAQINEYNSEFAQRSDKIENKVVKEEPKKIEKDNAFESKISHNHHFNRITQLGPFNKFDSKDSSDEISFSFEEKQKKNIPNQNQNQKVISDQHITEKFNSYLNNANNFNFFANNSKNLSSNHHQINDIQNKSNNYFKLNHNNNTTINDLNPTIDLNQKKQDTLNMNTNTIKTIAPVPILKNPFNIPNAKDNKNIVNTNHMNIFNNNLLNEPHYVNNKDKVTGPAIILPNKLFETNSKINPLPLKDSTEIEKAYSKNHDNFTSKDALMNILGGLQKKALPKKVTLGINDILNTDNCPYSSENDYSNRNSEKNNKNKFERKRRSIKRDTLNFLKRKDFTQVSLSSDDEKSILNKEPQHEKEENLNVIMLHDLKTANKPNINNNKEENNLNDKMDICQENKQLPNKTNEDINNKNTCNTEEIEDNIANDEAEEILKNFERNVDNNFNTFISLFDQNKNNLISKNNNNSNNNYNPFLSAVKYKQTNLKENEDKPYNHNDVNLHTPNTPYNKEDYLLATPGKYFITNNSSKIKEKAFSKFTGIKPDFNILSLKTRKFNEEIKEEMSFINQNNAINPFLIVNNNNKQQNPKSQNLFDLKDSNKHNKFNSRITIDKLVDFEVDEEKDELELSSFDQNNTNSMKINSDYNNQKLEEMENDQKQNDDNKVAEIPIIEKNKFTYEKNQFNRAAESNDLNQNIPEVNLYKKENNIYEQENKPVVENFSFSKFANENIINFNIAAELEKEDTDFKAITKAIRDRNNKLFEYLKEIFKSRFIKMKNTEKALNEKEEHLKTLKNQTQNFIKESKYYENEIVKIDSTKRFFDTFDKYYKFFSRNFLYTKVLGIEFNTVKLIYADRINLSFVFDQINYKIFCSGSDFPSNDDYFSTNNYNLSGRTTFEAIKLNEAQKKSLSKTKVMLKSISFFFYFEFHG